jgi:hypothetical protein
MRRSEDTTGLLTKTAPSDRSDELDWTEFQLLNGRIPTIKDNPKPWEYRGWLMHYRMMIEDDFGYPLVWNYWARTNVSSRLLEEPIPQISYEEHREGYKHLEKLVDICRKHNGGWSPVSLLLDWLSWGFALSKEKPKLDDRFNEELYRAINLHVWLQHPSDYLGT